MSGLSGPILRKMAVSLLNLACFFYAMSVKANVLEKRLILTTEIRLAPLLGLLLRLLG